MQFTFEPMTEADARTILAWRYEGIYTVYNNEVGDEGIAEMLDRRSPYYSVRDERGELVGFFCYGTAAQVWDSGERSIYSENNTISIGLGLRPDLTSKGFGLAFVEAGLAFAKEHFAPDNFRLFVLSFNERAIKVYERAGFQRVHVFVQSNMYGENEFVEMRRKA